MRRQRYSQLANKLQPYMNQSSVVIFNTGEAPGDHVHDFTGLEGELLPEQAPWVTTALNALKPHGLTDPVYHSVTGAALSVVGLTADNTIGLLSSTSDGLANPSTLLRSGSFGSLTIGALQASANLDTQHILGRAVIGAIHTTNTAAFKHGSALRSALYQTADGITTLDASEGMRTEFAINGTVYSYLDANQLRFLPSTRLQTDNYSSQLAGWRLTYGGELDVRYIFANEMRIIKFIADMQQALAGSQIISKSVTTLAEPFTAPRPGLSSALIVDDLPSGEDIQVFEDGDTVLVHETTREAGGFSSVRCWGTVSGYEDLADKKQLWSFTRLGTYSTDTPNPATASKWGIPSTSNTLTLPGPTAGGTPEHAQTGNLMLAVVLVESTSITTTTPAGWTLHQTATVTGMRFSLYSKVRTSSEAGNYYWVHSAAVDSMGWIVTYQGQDPVSPILTTIHTHETATQFPVIKHITQINDLDVVLGFVAGRANRSPVTPPDGWDLEYTATVGGNTLAVFSTLAGAEVGDVTARLFGGTARCVTITVNMTAMPAPLDLISGYMPVGNVVEPDAIILDYGVSGNGWHEVSAIDGYYGSNAPYSRVVSWTGHPATGAIVRTQSGNLNGIFGEGAEWGFFAGNGVSPTVSQFLRLSDRGARLNNLALSLYSAGEQRVNISADGLDVWVGTLADRRLSWNGAALAIKGAVTIDQASGFAGSGYLQIGAGVKDSDLNGFHLSATEIVGQAAGIDQVIMATDGLLKAGGGDVTLSADGIKIKSTSSYAFKNALSFTNSGGNEESRLFVANSAGQVNFNLDAVPFASTANRNSIINITATPIGTGTGQVNIAAQSIDGTINLTAAGGTTIIGPAGEAWANLSFGSGWTNYGLGYQTARYKKFGDLIFLKGLVARTSGIGTTIAALPAGYRPTAGNALFASMTNSGIGRVDINTSGSIILVGGGADWVQLDGLVFSTL